MNQHQRKLAAKMLKAYSDVLSCRGCDDYPMEDTPENREIERLVVEWSGDPDLELCKPNQLCLNNWMVASTLSSLLEKQ